MVSELGSEEKVAEYYRKESFADLRKQLFDVNKSIALAREMQSKVRPVEELPRPGEVHTSRGTGARS